MEHRQSRFGSERHVITCKVRSFVFHEHVCKGKEEEETDSMILKMKRFPKFSLSTWIVLCILLTYPINIPLVSILRPVDLFIVFAVLIAFLFGRIRTSAVSIQLVLLSGAMIVSIIAGFVLLPSIRFSIEGAGFVIKYIELFLLVWLIQSLDLKERDIDVALRLSLTIFLIMIAYTYFRFFLGTFGIVSFHKMGGLRPDFPFSNLLERRTNAGHLFGAYLSTGAVAVTIFLLQKKKKLLYILCFLLFSFGAMLLTGSRGPLAAFFLTALIFLMDVYFSSIKISKYRTKILNLSILVVILLLALVVIYIGATSDELNRILTRIIEFDFTTDRSAQARVIKMLSGIENVSWTGYWIGAGVFAYPKWFDNGIIRIVNDFGIIGFIILLWLIINLFRRMRKSKTHEGELVIYITLAYLANNLSTEFFLVPRASVPFFLAVILLIKKADAKAAVCNVLPENTNEG